MPEKVPVHITVKNLGFPRKAAWQNWAPFGEFKPNPTHEWPLAVQRKWFEARKAVDEGKREFTHFYEKSWRNRWFGALKHKAWKAPVVKFGEQIAARESEVMQEFESFKNRVMGQLEVKNREDLGGTNFGRQVA